MHRAYTVIAAHIIKRGCTHIRRSMMNKSCPTSISSFFDHDVFFTVFCLPFRHFLYAVLDLSSTSRCPRPSRSYVSSCGHSLAEYTGRSWQHSGSGMFFQPFRLPMPHCVSSIKKARTGLLKTNGSAMFERRTRQMRSKGTLRSVRTCIVYIVCANFSVRRHHEAWCFN